MTNHLHCLVIRRRGTIKRQGLAKISLLFHKLRAFKPGLKGSYRLAVNVPWCKNGEQFLWLHLVKTPGLSEELIVQN